MYHVALVVLAFCGGVLTGAAIMVAWVAFILEARHNEDNERG